MTSHAHDSDMPKVEFQAVFDALPEAVIVVDTQGIVLQANPMACAMIGKPIERIAGQPIAQVLSKWPDLTKRLDPIDQLELITLPSIFQGIDHHWYMLTPSTLHDVKNQTVGWVFLIRDITEQRETERKNQQLAAVIEQAQETIVITDLDGNIVYANPHFETTTGYTVQEAIGETPRILRSNKQDAEFYKKLWEVITRGKAWSGTFINKRKNGSLYHEAAIIFPLKDADGTVTGYAAVKRDITAQVETEDALETAVHQQSLLNEIIHAAIKQTDFEQMLQTLADRIGELLNANGCYITLWDEERKLVIPAAASGPFEKEYRQYVSPSTLDQPSNTNKALTTGQPVFIENIYDMSNWPTPLTPETLARIPNEPGLALPLIAHGQKLGAVLLAFAPDRKLTPGEVRLGMQAADQIALAMLKAKLLEQAEQRAREAETLRLAGAAVVASLKQDETIERILEAMNQVVPYDSGAVLLPKNKATEVKIVGARGFKYQIVGLGFPINEGTPSKIVFDTCKPHIIYDVQEHYEDFRHPPYDHIRGWMGIPLIIQDHIIGMLTLDSKEPGRFTPAHARLAQAFADQVAIALENARLFEETRRLATIDSLTKIYNRGHFMKLAQREFKRAVRYHKPLSLIMFDIDYFKQVNDTYGHITGDKTLQAIVQRCLDNLRSVDIMGRYGGEEFVILLPETALGKQTIAKDQQSETIQPARTVAERLRHAFSQEPLQIGQHIFTLTISLGVTEHYPDDQNIEDLINRADQALLKAKSQGRNQVIICNPGGNVA